jgi:RIO kinase 2
MSAVEIATEAYRELESEDHKILLAIERKKKNYEFAPKESIPKEAKLPPEEVEYRLPKLVKVGLVQGWRDKYTGYNLTTAGHDILAIHVLVKEDIIKAFGKALGVGKESDVYDALAPNEERIAIKFHRLGRTSFRKTKIKRDYTTEYNYTPNWHHRSRIAARREYMALKRLYLNGVAVPRPIKQTRHVLAMTMIEGAELFHHHNLQNPKSTLAEILLNVRMAYQATSIIHGDLSPYNIIMKADEHVSIIDWPQNISTNHPNSKEILERDLHNILAFFKRKYKIENTLEETLIYITGKKQKVK